MSEIEAAPKQQLTRTHTYGCIHVDAVDVLHFGTTGGYCHLYVSSHAHST